MTKNWFSMESHPTSVQHKPIGYEVYACWAEGNDRIGIFRNEDNAKAFMNRLQTDRAYCMWWCNGTPYHGFKIESIDPIDDDGVEFISKVL